MNWWAIVEHTLAVAIVVALLVLVFILATL